MKFIVQDINDLSDSREVLESRPNAFTTIFIYILLAIIGSALIWSFFSEKEVVIKANGIVRPNEDIVKVTNLVPGKVTSISFNNGEEVKEGDVLYTLDSSEMDTQSKSIEDKINNSKQEIDNLNKFKDSINNGTNLFDSSNEKERDYYEKYESYVKNNSVISDIDGIGLKKSDINSKINSLNLLKKSINENKNYCEANSTYSEQYNSYKLSIKDINDKISKDNEVYNSLKDKDNSDTTQLRAIDAEINSYKNQLQKIKSEYNIKISSSIDELNSSLKELDENSKKATQSNDLNKDKNKSATLVQIEDTIKQYDLKLKDLNDNLSQVNENIDKCSVKATKDGILDVQSDLKLGDVIQVGTNVANILPNESEYKVEMAIADKDIASLKEGQEIKYSFPSLPYKEYGFLNGKVNKISADSKLSKNNGLAFYTAESTLESSEAFSYKGEQADIKPGMTCESKIVVRKIKMLFYLLEKLNLKD